jgi:hypothetical protein
MGEMTMMKILGSIWAICGTILIMISMFGGNPISTISFRDIAGLILVGFGISWTFIKS